MFDWFARVWEAKKKNTCLGMETGLMRGPPFIKCHYFMSNGPNESNFLRRPMLVPNLRPLELIVLWKIALPLIRRTFGPRVPVDDKVSSKLGGIVKKTIFLNPTPTIRVPTKSGHFTITKDDFFIFSLFIRASCSMDNFNLMKKTNHIPSGVISIP